VENMEEQKEEKVREPSELDMAQLKFEMRQLYKHLGYEGTMQVFYEMLLGANALGEVIVEERSRK
jgi:hypothetical protein